jgi:hypothetical protein
MAAAPHDERRDATTREADDRLSDLIAEQTLHALGRPPDLLRLQVCRLWPGRYRVNVLVGADTASARVAHSYFITAAAEGNIIVSVPAIVKLY